MPYLNSVTVSMDLLAVFILQLHPPSRWRVKTILLVSCADIPTTCKGLTHVPSSVRPSEHHQHHAAPPDTLLHLFRVATILKTHLNISHPSLVGPSKGHLPIGFPHQNCVSIARFFHIKIITATVKTLNGWLWFKIGKHRHRIFTHGDFNLLVMNKSNTAVIPKRFVGKNNSAI